MDQKTFLKFSIFFSAVYFFSANGLGALSNLSLNFLLKEKMQLSASQAAYFQAIMLTSWVIKPLWGYISDSFPLFGYRRKSYLMLTSFIAGAAWLSLAGVSNYTVILLLTGMTMTSMAYAFQDVATDGLMVEVGKPANLTGRFQSFQWAAVHFAMVITALTGGYLADKARTGAISYQTIFSIAAVFPFITMLLAWKLVTENKVDAKEVREKVSFRSVFAHREIWLLASFLFLWTFSPSFGAPFFYYSVDTLKFSGSYLGALQALGSFAAFLTALIAGRWIDRLPIRKFLVGAIFAGVILILLHQIYFLPWMVARLELVRILTLVLRVPLAMFEALLFLMIVNLAARISPQYAGGSVFALLMSFYNLGQMGSSVLGGMLYPIMGLQPLMIFSALFSFLALLILPFLSIPESLTPLEQSIKAFFKKFIKV